MRYFHRVVFLVIIADLTLTISNFYVTNGHARTKNGLNKQSESDGMSFSAPGILVPDKSVIYKGFEWEANAISNILSWDDAVTYCDRLELNDRHDWRLPSKDELKSLVKCSNGKPTPLPDWKDRSRNKEKENEQLATCCMNYPQCNDFIKPTINAEIPCGSRYYWSSTKDEVGKIWGVNFWDGRTISGYYPEIPANTRCVRDFKK